MVGTTVDLLPPASTPPLRNHRPLRPGFRRGLDLVVPIAIPLMLGAFVGACLDARLVQAAAVAGMPVFVGGQFAGSTTLTSASAFPVGPRDRTVSGRNILSQFSVQVQALVLPYQCLEVVEPLAAEFTYPWPGVDKGDPLLLAAVGAVDLQTNAAWQIGLWPSLLPGFRIEVRPAGDEYAAWTPVQPDHPSTLVGAAGRHHLRWDIRIAPTTAVSPGRYQFGLTPVASVL